MRYGSLFSGIEAASLAFRPLGWKSQWFAEIDPFPCAVLKHHYPEVPNLGDVTKVDWNAVGPVDLIIGGSPCQSFSIAGHRLGLDDARGNLALVMLQIVGRLRPTWICYENVPGLLSSDEGRDFGIFLGLLGKLGYGFAYRVLDAQYGGVPQRRRRLFVVGYLGDWRPAAAVLFNQESLLGHPPPSRQARERIARPITPGSKNGSGYRNDADTADNLIPETIGTLTSAGGTEKKHGHGWGQREVESGHMITTGTLDSMGGGADENDAKDGRLIAAFGGNNTAGPIDVATARNAHGGPHGRLDFESETFVTHALRADGFDASEDGTGRGTPLVTSFSGGASDIISAEDLSQPVTGRNGDPGMIAFDTTQITSKTNRSQPASGKPSHPLTSTGHPPAIAFSQKDHGGDSGDVSPTLRGMGHHKSHANAGGQVAVAFQESQSGFRETEAHATLDSNNGSRRHNGVIGAGVRRLTPVECERLMDMPDNYTLVPYRGKPASDGPRYKAIGNSMVVAEVRWIGERIQAVQEIIDGLPPRSE